MSEARNSMWEQVVYSYKGYEYIPEEEVEEDNRKTFHVVRNKFGDDAGWLPLSPYSHPSRAFFEAWIDAGLPKDKNNRRPSLEDLQDIAFTKHFEQELGDENA